MPIRPHWRAFYRGKWLETRSRILERAGWCCEECGRPDRGMVWLLTGRMLDRGRRRAVMLWIPAPLSYRDREGDEADARYAPAYCNVPLLLKLPHFWWRDCWRLVETILTVAHLDHTPGHDDDSNLRAWCQWCHLNYDQAHHHETRSERKDAQRPLLLEEEGVHVVDTNVELQTHTTGPAASERLVLRACG